MPKRLDIFTKPPKKSREGDGKGEIKAKLLVMESLTKALKYGKPSGKSKDEKAMLGMDQSRKWASVHCAPPSTTFTQRESPFSRLPVTALPALSTRQ
jgi:hypothetical protein